MQTDESIDVFVEELVSFINEAPNNYSANPAPDHENVILVGAENPVIAVFVKRGEVELMGVDRKDYVKPLYTVQAYGAVLGVSTFIEIYKETYDEMLKRHVVRKALKSKKEYKVPPVPENLKVNNNYLKNNKLDLDKILAKNKKLYKKYYDK